MLSPIYLLAFDNVGATSIAGPIDIFHTTNLLLKNLIGKDAEQLKWHIVGLNRNEVSTAGGMKVQPDLSIDEIKEPGWLIIPGVVIENEFQLDSHLNANQHLAEQIAKLYRSGFGMAANCTGTFLLAETGILDGKTATTTWWLEHFFQTRYPRIELDIDSVIIEQERILCSGTAMAHMELALHLVSTLVGGKYAHLCRKYLLMENQQKTQAPYRRLSNAQKDPFIQAANRYLFEHLHEEIRIDALAEHLAVSNRTLIRRFKQATGDTPLQHIQKLRVERSKYLLETSQLPTEEIVQRVGYQDSSTFGRTFKRFTGLTPGQYRQKFEINRD